MTTQEIATKLVGLLRAGRFEEAQRGLLSEYAESTEPNASFFPEKTIGLDNILRKGATFRETIEALNGLEISDPLVAGNTIAITFILDANFKNVGRLVFSEICVFVTDGGKITQEVYFY